MFEAYCREYFSNLPPIEALLHILEVENHVIDIPNG